MAATYCFGPKWSFELQTGPRKLLRDGLPVAMGARAFDVLLALVDGSGDLVTKDDLLRLAWRGLVVEEANVYVTIAQLRKVVGTDAIATVGGLGYRFTLAVRQEGTGQPRHNLPSERTSFVGRQAVLDDAQARLRSSRMLTLIGIGGTGKTRLALKLGEFALTEHRHGVVWVDLAPSSNATGLTTALATALGCKLNGKEAPLQTISAFARGLELLVVLDNCEHLLNAAVEVADALLSAGPSIHVLATSREALGTAGEVVLPIRPLELPAPNAPAHEIVHSEAVHLFLDRVHSVAPGLVVDDALTAVVADICRRLDGLPLALELAAARMRLLSGPQLLQLLDERFLLLTGGHRAIPRQQTLQAMIHWSYEASGAQAQRAMRVASACNDGCDLDALAALLGEPDRKVLVIESLGPLLDKDLVVVQHRAEATRYTMLETVRQFALERLGESGEASAVRDRHREYFLQLAESAERHSTGEHAAAWMLRLEQEHANLLSAMGWCEAPGGSTAGMRFVVAMRRYWLHCGELRLGRDLALQALAREGTGAPTALRGHALCVLAQSRWWLGEASEALGHGVEALQIATAVEDKRLQARALMGMSYSHGLLGNHTEAGRHAMDALQAARGGGNEGDVCNALIALADHHYESGDLLQAARLFREALELRERNNDAYGQGLAVLALAEIDIALGQFVSARDWLRQASALVERTRSRLIGLHLIERSAALAARDGSAALALRWFAAAAANRRASGRSDQTMSARQREESLARAKAMMEPDAAKEAEQGGSEMDFEHALEEVQAWLSSTWQLASRQAAYDADRRLDP